MGPPAGGEIVSIGLEYCLLETDGRIRCAYQFIVPGAPASAEASAKGFVFSAHNVEGHHDTVRFDWEMRPNTGGPVAAGSTLVLLDDAGQIRRDYQFD